MWCCWCVFEVARRRRYERQLTTRVRPPISTHGKLTHRRRAASRIHASARPARAVLVEARASAQVYNGLDEGGRAPAVPTRHVALQQSADRRGGLPVCQDPSPMRRRAAGMWAWFRSSPLRDDAMDCVSRHLPRKPLFNALQKAAQNDAIDSRCLHDNRPNA